MIPLITPLTSNDIDTVAALARIAWQDAYPGIIKPAQIDFLHEQRYDTRRLL